jgi:hypothetical protein
MQRAPPWKMLSISGPSTKEAIAHANQCFSATSLQFVPKRIAIRKLLAAAPARAEERSQSQQI